MKNIALIMQGSRQWSGGLEYIRNLVKALAAAKAIDPRIEDLRIQLVIRGPVDPEYYEDLKPLVHAIVPINEGRLAYLRFLIGNSFDFIYPYFRTSGFLPNLRGSAWIPDFQHKHLPDYFSKKDREDRDKLYEAIAKNNSQLVLSSDAAAQDFEKFYRNKAPSIKAHVLRFRTRLGDEIFSENPALYLRKYHLPDKFFMISNQWWAHKNHEILIKALQQIKLDHDHAINLVWTGHPYDTRRSKHCDYIFSMIHECGLHNHIRILGLIPRRDQIQIMRSAKAVIQPSRFEGWSTVVEDARCLGKEIIASDLTVHREQLGNEHDFFAADDFKKLAELMTKAWINDELGFDSKREEAAQNRNLEDVQNYGMQFVDLCGF